MLIKYSKDKQLINTSAIIASILILSLTTRNWSYMPLATGPLIVLGINITDKLSQ